MRLILTANGEIEEVGPGFGRGLVANAYAQVDSAAFAGGETEAREYLKEIQLRMRQEREEWEGIVD